MDFKSKLGQAKTAIGYVKDKAIATKEAIVTAKTTVLDVLGASAFVVAATGIDWRLGCVVFGAFCFMASKNLTRQAVDST